MSEYIIKAADWAIDYNGESLFKDCEEIVRCRDCAYKRNGWNGKRPTFSDWFFCAYCGGHELTNLNGFCSWGEKRSNESNED